MVIVNAFYFDDLGSNPCKSELTFYGKLFVEKNKNKRQKGQRDYILIWKNKFLAIKDVINRVYSILFA